jgi:hypothetical protein
LDPENDEAAGVTRRPFVWGGGGWERPQKQKPLSS